MCCGSRRSAWRSAATAPASASGRQGASGAPAPTGSGLAPRHVPSTVRGPFPSVFLDCLEDAAIRVRGPVTGQRYDFSPSRRSQAVDARDAAVLSRSSSFRRSAS